MNECEAIQTLLDARAVVYGSLARAFAEEPTEKLLELFCGEEYASLCSLMDDERSALASHRAHVVDAIKALGFDGCAHEFNRWFVGQKLKVHPWESVHVTGENVLFQAVTLKVREAYLAQGFKAAGYPHYPDDHIATEFDFMAKLAERASAAYGDEAARSKCVGGMEASRSFATAHLARWANGFARSFDEAIEEKSPSRPGRGEDVSLYAALAHFGAAVVAADEGLLAELQEAVG